MKVKVAPLPHQPKWCIAITHGHTVTTTHAVRPCGYLITQNCCHVHGDFKIHAGKKTFSSCFHRFYCFQCELEKSLMCKTVVCSLQWRFDNQIILLLFISPSVSSNMIILIIITDTLCCALCRYSDEGNSSALFMQISQFIYFYLFWLLLYLFQLNLFWRKVKIYFAYFICEKCFKCVCVKRQKLK